MQKQKQKPAKTIRMGLIKAVIWRNRSRENGFFYNIEIVRGFKRDGVWEDTTSFSADDLLKVQKVADRAFDWIYDQSEAEKDVESEHDSEDDSEE